MTRSAFDAQGTVKFLNTFAHLAQSEVAKSHCLLQDLQVKSLAIVLYNQGQRVRFLKAEFYPDRSSVCVLSHVVESLLGNAEQDRFKE